MRLFVALPVAEDARARIRDAVAPRRDDDRVAWTRPDGWHLTLAFLGDVADDRLADVAAAVEAGVAGAGTGPVALATGRVVRLGRGALGVEVVDDPPGAAAGLGEAVQHALADADLPVQHRAVRPHLTLGRARRRRPVPGELADAIEVPATGWTADRVEVVESVLGRGPAAYRPVADVALAGSDA